jgi:CRISPR/Cas system CMR-associated protein Cmr5 small subunit
MVVYGCFCDIYKVLNEEQKINLFNMLLNDIDNTKYNISHITYNSCLSNMWSDINHPMEFVSASKKHINNYLIEIPSNLEADNTPTFSILLALIGFFLYYFTRNIFFINNQDDNIEDVNLLQPVNDDNIP